MAIIKKFSPFLNLSNFQVFLNDTQRTSQYFRISDFGDTFTGGKNGFLIEGSEFLKETTEIKIEILDVNGNPIYFEPGDGIPEYYEGISKLVSVHIYDDTPIGLGKITILGELKNYVNENGTILPIPDEWKGIYNVKWERTFQINRNLNNETIVRFYKRPQVTITELVKPIFSKSVPTVTDTGYVHGIPELPPFGTDIRTWRAGTLYKLQRTNGSWDRDVDENTITISNPSHTAKIIEVLNDREVLVDIPYTTSNNVSSFLSGSYSVTYSDFQNEIIGESTLTGSFAKIDITQLKTFVGDVARVKVFRKSRNSVGDFQFVQESKLESSELLRDITTPTDTELSYGLFDEYNLSNYWEVSSIDHPTTINSSVLSQAVKVDYNGSGVQKLITSQSFSLSKDVEYTLNFRTLLSGSTTPDKTLKAYFSGSNFTQDFLTISGSSIYTTRQNVSQNILSENTGNAKLVFEFKGDDWYLSNVSLKNAQDTSFSPDEFTLIQDIPRKLASETFDFRFEFYDINNNYIPVNVTAVGVFDGGNDYPTSGKLLTFESDRNAFRFSSGSVQNPTGQQIQFKVTQNNLTGSVTFASSAFDVDGNYLQPSDYTQYPGLLTSVSPAGAIITINNFTGSRVDGLYTPFVGSVVYTASLENLQEFETVYRLEDGDNAPQLIVTSNANQFIYEPTTLSPKPSGQSITVRAQRKNLASLVTPLTLNKSNSNGPNLNYVDTVSGIDTYTISATEFSASFAQNNFDEITYSFTGSDVFGNEQSDEITISKVVNFDGVSVVLSNESVTFPAYSTGEVVGGFDASSGSVQMYIGGNQIQFDDSLSKNTFAITNLQGSGCEPFGGNGYDPLNNSYSISAMSTDSAQMNVTITYKAGDNSTTQQFEKVVSYTKAKDAVPNVEVSVTPNAQTVTSDSDGGNTSTPTSLVVRALEGGSTRLTTVTATGTGVTAGAVTYNPTSGSPKNYATIPLSAVTDDNSSVAIVVNYTDSEGTSGSKNLTATISRSKKASPVVVANLSSEAQTITKTAGGTYGTPATFTVSVNEGGSNYTYDGTSPYSNSSFRISTISGGTNSSGTITPTTPTTDAGTTVSMTISYVNSEGTAGTITKTHKVGVTTDGSVGADGVTIVPSKTSQNIVRDFEDLTFTTIQAVSHAVKQGSTTFTAVSSATALANSQYRIKPASLTNCTETANGVITPTQPTDSVFTTGGTASYTIQYKDGDGNQNEVAFTHEVTVTTNGTTGPGVVFSGEWASGVQYQFSTGVTGRRDAVIYSGTYYAVTAAHTSTSSGTTGPPGVGTNWESLGTGTRFSAAEISISKQSFIKETLTIGTNDIGSAYSANITLFGGNAYPYIAVGQATVGYGNNGIWIGNDGGTSKFSLVNGTSSFLKWNGSSLEIKGSISFTNSPDISTFNNDLEFTDDTAANAAQAAADAAQSDATTALTRPKVFRQDAQPSTTGVPGGSLWYDTNDDNKLYILVGTTWTATRDGQIAQAISDAASAQSTANGVGDDLQDVIDGVSLAGAGTFIDGKTIFSPLIAGTDGYISNTFKVGNGGITLDGPNKKIFTGTGTFANANTPFYVDNASNFSLGDKLSWNGTTLSIAGSVQIGGATASTVVSGAAAGASALQSGDDVSELNNNSGYQNNNATRTGGSVGGWGLEQYKIKGGAPTVGGDGVFTNTGIILGIEPVTGGGYISAQQFYISSSGDAVFSGVVSAGSIEGGQININNNFTVDSQGTMNATNANISGIINSDQATLGSWLVDEDSITAENGDITLNATDGYIYLKDAGVTKVNLNTDSVLTTPGAGGTLGPTSYNAASKLAQKVLSAVGLGPGGETSYQNITSFTPTTGGNWNLGYSYENGSSTYVQASGLGCTSTLNVYLDVLEVGYTGNVLKSTFIAGATVYGTDDEGLSVEQHTDILLDGGVTKQAKDVKTNDVLLVWDEISNLFVKTTVAKIRKKTNKLSYEVVVGDYNILVSPSHGFWLDGGLEIKVQDIIPGETKIYVKDEDDIKLLVVNEVNRIEGNEKVFITFEIPTYHNYVSNNIISHNPVGSGYPLPVTEYFSNRSGNLSFNATQNTTYYLRLRYEFGWVLYGSQYTTQRYAYYNSNFDGTYYGNALNAGTEINNAGLQVLSGQTRVFRTDTTALAAQPWITAIGGMNVDFFVPKYSHHDYGNFSYNTGGNTNIGYNKKAFPVTRAMCRFSGVSSNITINAQTPHINVATITRSSTGIYAVTLEEGLGTERGLPMVMSWGVVGDTNSQYPGDNEHAHNVAAKHNSTADTYTITFYGDNSDLLRDPIRVYFVVFG